MSANTMNNNFLQKVASFVKLAIDNNGKLQEELAAQEYAHRKQAAVDELNKEKYRVALKKAADALYNSDFLTDEYERRVFLKRAGEDPAYIVNVLEKVCEAADVAQIGKPARVAARPKEAEYDPVMEAAFGFNSNRSIIDE